MGPGPFVRRLVRPLVALGLVAAVAGACGSAAAPATPRPVAGSSDAPREVNIIAKDRSFLPDIVDFIPGETVLLHVINGGLEVHEAVIGDAAVQDAWEAAEAATEGAPPGPTPVVSVPPDVSGIRVVVQSGERVDLVWTVPPEAAAAGEAWVVGCHIPGHWEAGMVVPVRWVDDPQPPIGVVAPGSVGRWKGTIRAVPPSSGAAGRPFAG